MSEFLLDFARPERIGLPEAIYSAGKSVAQIAGILTAAEARGTGLLLTRLDEERFGQLPRRHQARMDFDPASRTAFFGEIVPLLPRRRVAVLTAGTSDVPVAREATRTLRYAGHAAEEIFDVGVAGLWRLLRRIEEIRTMSVVIVAAGMDAALPSVVAGLVPGMVIAVPTSVGYGVAAGGHAALNAILASCAPGIVTVNIDNGYGAACAALRILHAGPAGAETHAWSDAISP